MIKLRSVNGSNLKVLENMFEKADGGVVILSVNYVGTNWYIHYLIQDVHNVTNDVENAGLNIQSTLPKKKGK